MIHLRLEAREDEDVTVWDYCGKVEGYEVPARLTVETEDGVLAETFEGSIALDEDLQYAFNSYVRLVVEPRESLRDRFEGIAESCAEPRSYWLALYDPDGTGSQPFPVGTLETVSLDEEDRIRERCWALTSFTLRVAPEAGSPDG